MTQASLKSLLYYNEKSGIFTWIKSNVVAGSYDNKGYIQIKSSQRVYRAHRLAWLYMYGSFPDGHLDHINHIRDDNSILNLREASFTINQRNRSINTNNKSGFTGVCYRKSRQRWRATIKVHNKTIELGSYAKLEDAISARKLANIKYGFHENHGNNIKDKKE